MQRLIKCGHCGCVEPESEYRYGRGKKQGQHELHRYCGHCGMSIDWVGAYYVPLVYQKEFEDMLAGLGVKA